MLVISPFAAAAGGKDWIPLRWPWEALAPGLRRNLWNIMVLNQTEAKINNTHWNIQNLDSQTLINIIPRCHDDWPVASGPKVEVAGEVGEAGVQVPGDELAARRGHASRQPGDRGCQGRNSGNWKYVSSENVTSIYSDGTHQAQFDQTRWQSYFLTRRERKVTEFGNPNLKTCHSMSFTGNIDKSMNQNKYRRGELKIVVMVTKRNKKLSIKSYFSLQPSLINLLHPQRSRAERDMRAEIMQYRSTCCLWWQCLGVYD